MCKISLKANAKINLGLDVLGVLENGYHEVRMVMQSLELADEIVLEKTGTGISIITDSAEIPKDENNLCYKAAALMREEYGISEGVAITVKKNIPVAAGLAGGSADAAAGIEGMNRLFKLSLSTDELMAQGFKTGADVPFCILKGTALAQGMGEKLTGLKKLPKCGIILFKPDFEILTGYVYKKLDEKEIRNHPDIDGIVRAIEDGELRTAASLMGNVLEEVTAEEHPVIGRIRDRMISDGAVNAMMSGSGPTVFGIFDNERRAMSCYTGLCEDERGGRVILTEPMLGSAAGGQTVNARSWKGGGHGGS